MCRISVAHYCNVHSIMQVLASCTTNPCGALISCLMSSVPVETGTFIGVVAGVSVFLVLSVLTLVAIILVVVVVRRKVTYEQKGDSKMEGNLYYSNVLMAKKEHEVEENGLVSAGHDCDYADKNEVKVETVDVIDPYEDVDGKVQIKTTMKLAPNESSTPVGVTNIGDLYAVVDKSQKKGAGKEKETVTNKEDLYAMPMKKKGKLTETGEGVVKSEGVEKREECNDTIGVKYEPKADSECGQQIEGDSKAQNVDVLYAVVDKSHKKKNEK